MRSVGGRKRGRNRHLSFLGPFFSPHLQFPACGEEMKGEKSPPPLLLATTPFRRESVFSSPCLANGVVALWMEEGPPSPSHSNGDGREGAKCVSKDERWGERSLLFCTNVQHALEGSFLLLLTPLTHSSISSLHHATLMYYIASLAPSPSLARREGGRVSPLSLSSSSHLLESEEEEEGLHNSWEEGKRGRRKPIFGVRGELGERRVPRPGSKCE